MSKITLLVVVILVLALILPLTSPILGAEENSNRVVNHGESIQQAINEVSEGSTVYLAAGNYVENVIINKSIALIGENMDETIIYGTELSPTLLISKVADVRVANLALRNSYKTGSPAVAGVRMWDAQNIEITKCRTEQCEVGIELANTTHCNITKNQIIDNDFYGLHLRDVSSLNVIYGNLISSNLNGIWVSDLASKNNTIYYNNFVNNVNQIGGFGIWGSVWDNGYPSGGNHWSDYSSVDLYRGLNQNNTGSDGIGDEFYITQDRTLDHYPITGMIHLFNVGRWDEVSYHCVVASRSNISDFHFNPDEGPFVMFNATNSEEQSAAFCRVTIPQRVLWVDNQTEWVVQVDGNSINVTSTQDDNYTYLYFTFDHDTQTIKIIGTYIIPEFANFLNLLIVITLMAIILHRIREKAL